MSDSPTWYDLLGVDQDATEADIRAAWKTGTADLEPGDRRFDTLNRAARVLLDPAARREYDAGLAGAPVPAGEASATAPVAGPPTHEDPAEKARRKEQVRREARERRAQQREARAAAGAGPDVPTWMLAALAALALVMVVATVWLWQGRGAGSEEAARDAQAAAERAVVPVLSYDFSTLEEDQEQARSYLTSSYREEYDELFGVIEENAPSTRTRVGAQVVASGIVRSGEDRVEVLVFVDRPTTNKVTPQPTVYKDQVTLTMQRVDDEWLVDDMVTSPVQG